MPMNRRVLMASVAVFAASMAAAHGQEQVELTVVHGSPTGHVVSRGTEQWMECVKEAAGDRVDFRYYPAGQISGTPEVFQAMSRGIADIVPIPIGYVSDKMPLNGVSMLPGFGSTAREIMTAYSQAVEEGVLAREFAANKAVPLWVMGFPPYQIISTDGDVIKSVEDFGGKVIRSAGGSMNLVLTSLGASPAEIPVGDMYIALERGTADGTISALSSVKPFNVDEIMEGVSTNGSFGTFTNVLSIRTDRWEALPADIQETMKDCSAQTEESLIKFMDEEAQALAKEFADKGVEVFEFTPEQLEAINERLSNVTEDWVNRLASRGLPASEVLESYSALFKQGE